MAVYDGVNPDYAGMRCMHCMHIRRMHCMHIRRMHCMRIRRMHACAHASGPAKPGVCIYTNAPMYPVLQEAFHGLAHSHEQCKVVNTCTRAHACIHVHACMR
eukprot:354907-Chlamydomonas_euryale.AAC.2